MSEYLADILGIIVVMLTILLWAAFRYQKHRESHFDTWVRLRIQAEMGVIWYECWKHLDLDTLWNKFTYDRR
jgi:hypothetical protein